MLFWHSSFSYFSLTLRRVKCNLVWQWKRKLHLFWLTWIRFVLLQGCFSHFHSENVGQFERENHISSLISLIPPRALKEREQRKTRLSMSQFIPPYLCGSLRTFKWFATLTVATPVFKVPNVNLSNFIYVVRYVYLSSLLRWQLWHPYLKPQIYFI